jgi:hypothetical protein
MFAKNKRCSLIIEAGGARKGKRLKPQPLGLVPEGAPLG